MQSLKAPFSFLIESSPVPIYQRITTAYQQALERHNQRVLYVEPDKFSDINEAFNYLAKVVQSDSIDYLLVFENSPLLKFYIQESDRFLFELSSASIIFIHYDNFWSSLTDPHLLQAWHRVCDRSIHFCLEYANFLDLRAMGFEYVDLIKHGSEFELISPPEKYRHDLSFVGHILPDFKLILDPYQHLPFSHLIAADFWSRLVALDKQIDPSAVAFASANQPDQTAFEAEYIDRKCAYHSLISLMSPCFRGELIKRIDSQFKIAIVGGDPAYLHGLPYDRRIERETITYYPAVSNYTDTANLYAHSKINLNITSPQFDTAVNNRVIDVACVGGFILTDWKADLAQLTSVSEQISYRTIDELNYKIDYYLHHEDERLEIANQMHWDVTEKCSYDQIVTFIISRIHVMSNQETQSGVVRVDLGCGIHKPEGFIGVDVSFSPNVDIVANLNQRFPFPDNSVDLIRAYDVVEHLSDRIHTMNEIWRVCKPNAEVDIRVPSTDGRGAFQDPTHISFWNINSFNYYCVEFPAYLNLCHSYGFKGAFSIIHLAHEDETVDQVVHVRAVLKVIKPDSPLDIQQRFNLKAINLIVCPNWYQAEEVLYAALAEVIRVLAVHPDRRKITLLVDATNFPEEFETNANQVLYDLVLNLFLTEGIDIAEELEISLIEGLSLQEQSTLAQKISYRIPLPEEDFERIFPSITTIPLCTLETLKNQQFS
jgi:spore maturation protein CgeB